MTDPTGLTSGLYVAWKDVGGIRMKTENIGGFKDNSVFWLKFQRKKKRNLYFFAHLSSWDEIYIRHLCGTLRDSKTPNNTKQVRNTYNTISTLVKQCLVVSIKASRIAL